ncbi:MAG: hypothetical protein Hyperionvirus42_10 [Hyperionvirus sp.]|uniref:Uncharacterized protein n=1 Tax=Hyperionvirus sp. TaxID=2487770 RepID=A0A3G5AE01_9VIRU|nr:MAG: hypothetical protein Hyperionvirus42_10 [Hyperionvirus sp.]
MLRKSLFSYSDVFECKDIFGDVLGHSFSEKYLWVRRRVIRSFISKYSLIAYIGIVDRGYG